MSYTSRLPRISVEIAARMDATTKAVAEQIERRAKNRVPVATGRLRDAIHTERKGPGEHDVIAGNEDVFYGHIVEHGGANTPARPFLTPAIEETKPEIQALGAKALRNL